MVVAYFGIALTKSIMALGPDGESINFGYVKAVAKKKVSAAVEMVANQDRLLKNLDFGLASMVE